MIVYRLESDRTEGGPFVNGGYGTPNSWRHTHEPPNYGNTPSAKVFREWREKHNLDHNLDEGTLLPEEYLFSFQDIGILIDCFEGFEEIPHMKLYEIEIDRFYPEDYCILPDGQVIFRLEKSRTLLEL